MLLAKNLVKNVKCGIITREISSISKVNKENLKWFDLSKDLRQLWLIILLLGISITRDSFRGDYKSYELSIIACMNIKFHPCTSAWRSLFIVA